MAKSIGNPQSVFSPAQKAIDDIEETLNNLEGVDMRSFFYYIAASVLSNPKKSVRFLKMSPEARLGWLIHLIGPPPS